MADFGTFTINQIIMHHVPRAGLGDRSAAPIQLSEAPVEVAQQDRIYIQSRMRKALASGYARPVVEAPDEGSPTPALVKDLLRKKGDLVASSQAVAQRLRDCQPGISPDGLLVMVVGTLATTTRCVLIAKVEHEEGVRVQQATVSGKLTYKTEYLKDLIFGAGTRVFKVGVFAEVDAHEMLRGHVVDTQQTQHGIASFFRGGVLGCQFLERADVLTQRFLDATEKWIKRVTDPERQARYEVALLAEIQSAAKSISVPAFASQHLEPEDQDFFLSAMEGADVRGIVPKDTSLVGSRIRRVKVQTVRNASVFVPTEMYEDGSVTISRDAETNISDIHLRDEVRSVTGASGPKAQDAS